MCEFCQENNHCLVFQWPGLIENFSGLCYILLHFILALKHIMITPIIMLCFKLNGELLPPHTVRCSCDLEKQTETIIQTKQTETKEQLSIMLHLR